MILTEKKKKIDSIICRLEEKMQERYQIAFYTSGKKCFKAREDEFFRLTRMAWANAVVVEHAFSESEAKRNMFEDGDLFDIEELDETQMLQQMIEEIEEQ